MSARSFARTQAALVLGAVLACQISGIREAHAGRCRRGFLTPRAPIALTLGPANFGAPSSACSYSSFNLDVGGVIDLELPDFYGAVAAEVGISGTVALNDRVWFSGSLTALRAGFVQNASIVTNFAHLGQSTLGAHVVLGHTERSQLATYLRVLLPTSSGTQLSADTGFDVGLSGLLVPTPWITVTGNLSVPVGLSFIGSSAMVRPGVVASSDIAFALWAFELAAGIEAKMGFAPTVALEHLAPRVALRAHFSAHTSLALSAVLPLAGADKTTVRAALSLVTVF